MSLSWPLPTAGDSLHVQDSLMARLDRLGAAKEIAQVGATIGREFTYELLHAVSPLDEETLQQGLRQLVEAELVYQRGLPPQATYLFKHALIQDTAYQSLLKSTRQQYASTDRPGVGEERFRRPSRPNPSCSRITTPRRGSSSKRFPIGSRRASWPSNVWRSRKRLRT